MTFRIRIATLLSAFLPFTAPDLQAQTVTPNEFDQKYSPNETSPFSNVSDKRGYQEEQITFKNAIKFCPTMLVRQKVAFFYERKIVEGLAVNMLVGKAFGNDALQSSYFTGWKDERENNSMTPGMALRYSEYYSSGMLFGAAVRLYFSGSAFDGVFFEFNYRRERLSYQLQPKILSRRVEGNTIADFRMSAFNFGFGLSNVGGARKHGTHEFFFMIGIKNFQHTKYELVDNSFFSGQQGDMVYRRSAADLEAKIIPALHVGYCFGFGF